MRTLRALFGGILDYAGLFPPATLDMAPMVRRYAKAVTGPESWFMGRVIVPVSRLKEFEEASRGLLPVTKDALNAPVWRLSALAPPLWEEQLDRALDAIDGFNERHADSLDGAAVIDTLECKVGSSEQIDEALDRIPEELFPYFELPVFKDVRGMVASMAGLDAGAKVRTGGVTAKEHPTTEQLADFIAACAGAEVPFKATAGLHHPLRNHNAAVPADQFGCVGIMLAAALLWTDRIEPGQVAEMLEDRDPASFRFDSENASWRGHRLSHAELLTARERFAHAFGSCSIDEPLADLEALGWLSKSSSASKEASRA